jgi:predicted dithiol-disulfide oxidoreductase (DUF899 family)
MTAEHIPHPPIANREVWTQERQALLVAEKALTRERDRVNALRRRLPMVPVADYLLDGPRGELRLSDVFAGQRQLIVYHFMFGPDWDAGCPVCTNYMNELCDLSNLAQRDTTFAIIARAPIAKIMSHKAATGIRFPFYSAYRSRFNYDFNVSDENGEGQGVSVFFRMNDQVYHTYSTYQRGVEGLTSWDAFLDITPYGRQQDFEDSPPGWPQRPTYDA